MSSSDAIADQPNAAAVAVEEAQPIEYFNAPSHRRASAFPGLVLGLIGLGLVVTGGCFLIGVLVMYAEPVTDWDASGVYLFMILLYALAALCFAGAVVFLRFAVISLLKAARG